MPKTIKGYQWFEQVSGKAISIEGVGLLGNNKGNTRYAATVVCKTREQAKDFAKRVKDRNEGPRAMVLNSDKAVLEFREEMAKSKGWSKEAPDGDKAITANTGADIRGDATGFKHGFNPYRKTSDRSRSRSRRRSPSPMPKSRSRSERRRRSPSPKRRSPSRRRSRSRRRSTSRRGRSASRRGRSPSRRHSRSRSRRGGSRLRSPAPAELAAAAAAAPAAPSAGERMGASEKRRSASRGRSASSQSRG